MANKDTAISGERMGFPHLVKWVEMAVRARVERVLRNQPISSSQLFALVLIDERGEVTAAELARLMHITPQAFTPLLRPLRAQGLIEREPDAAHRRRLTMRLTDAGRTVIAKARALTPEIEGAMLADFTDAERETLLRLLARIVRPLA
ncbi:MAG: hypothetical protein BGP16_13660 [Sphingobium sp. 66-54]|nr:MAG: hypothetical protein BGP16_13660 [Sphingobium sp. 66-54]